MRRTVYDWSRAISRVPITSVQGDPNLDLDESPEYSTGDLLTEILSEQDRDQISGALPVVSVHEDDEPEYLSAVAKRARSRITLQRRGVEHGALVELEGQRETLSGRALVKRWKNAEPLLLPGLLACTLVGGDQDTKAELLADYSLLRSSPGLRTWLTQHEALWSDEFELCQDTHAAQDPERDLECVRLISRIEPKCPPLWLKTGKLSTYAEDASLRLRFSFGREIDDDASSHPVGHAAVARLAQQLIPHARTLASNELLAQTLSKAFGGQPTFSQHIRYWNAPEGGARFHHDAFGLPDPSGQRGVAYLQISGATVWLALSVRTLARRVAELAEILADGELRHLRDTLFPGEKLVEFITLARDEARCMAELALPGCGVLGAVVDLGPEFTALLADGGHAVRLEPGDVLLLPNHGFDRTAMHSVFCASEQPGEALSVAIRKA